MPTYKVLNRTSNKTKRYTNKSVKVNNIKTVQIDHHFLYKQLAPFIKILKRGQQGLPVMQMINLLIGLKEH